MKIGLIIQYIFFFIISFFLSVLIILFITSNSIEDTNANLKITILQEDINTYLSKQRTISSLQQDFTITMSRFNVRINELEVNLTSYDNKNDKNNNINKDNNNFNCTNTINSISSKVSKSLYLSQLSNIIEVIEQLNNINQKLQKTLQQFQNLKSQLPLLENKINDTKNIIFSQHNKIVLLNDSLFQQNTDIKNQIELYQKNDKTRIKMIQIWKTLVEKMIQQSIIHYVNTTKYQNLLAASNSNISPTFNQSQFLHLFKKISLLQKELIYKIHSTTSKVPSSSQTQTLIPTSLPTTILKYSYNTLIDYALLKNGAQIIENLTSSTYSPQSSFPNSFKEIAFSLIGLPPIIGRPQEAITDELSLGHCWAMNSSKGKITILLSEPIQITSITIEHIQREDAIDITSAPSNIEVYGLKNLEEFDNRFITNINYDINSPISVQHFLVKDYINEVYPYVQIHILNNHGNSQYTCIYRIQIHGIPSHLLN